MFQNNLSYFIGWGNKNESSESNRALSSWHYWTTAGWKVTAFPVANNVVSLWIKDFIILFSCKHEDWVNQLTVGFYFCLANGWIYRHGWTFSVAYLLWYQHQLVLQENLWYKYLANSGPEMLEELKNFWILECVLSDSTNVMMGKTDGTFAKRKKWHQTIPVLTVFLTATHS